MLKIKSEFKRKYGKSLYYFIQASFFIFGFISWAFTAVSTGFVVPLEFMGGVLEPAVRVLYYLCTVENPPLSSQSTPGAVPGSHLTVIGRLCVIS